MSSFLRSLSLPPTTSFLDSGTGNGHMLFRLRSERLDEDADSDDDESDSPPLWTGRMLGTDYSTQSIEFARRIAADKGLGHGSEREVEFVEWDILRSPHSALLTGENKDGWDVVLDKGTFDAISLSDERDAQGRRIVEGYRGRIVPLMREGGLLLVTSCNWTEEELRGWFEGQIGEGEGSLVFERKIEYKSFSFGGRKGQTISSCCFKKSA